MTSSASSETTPNALAAGRWRLAQNRSELKFKTKAMGFLPVRGTFDEYSGDLLISDGGQAEGTLKVTTETISTGIAKRDAHLRTPDFFHVERHPHLSFDLTALTPTSDGKYRLQGTLHILERALAIDVPVALAKNGSQLDLDAAFEIDHHSAGFQFKHLPKRVNVEAHLVLEPEQI